ncbi:DNA repair protein XRCC4 [Lissotriton helveticus]
MAKNVRQICVLSQPDKPHFLQISWEKDIGFGFAVILSDGLSAWSGKVSNEEVSKDAADMEMEREKYVDELKKALIKGTAQTSKYVFDFSKYDVEDDCYIFSYDKNLKDVVFRLGSLKLRNVPNPVRFVTDLISYCLNDSAALREQNEHLQRENNRLLSDWNDMQGQLEAWVRSKEELEQDIYTRFTLVLNEKKAKIRTLQDKLKDAQEKLDRNVSEAPLPTKGNNEDYDMSTDEENKNETPRSTVETVAPNTLSRRHSLLSSTDDVPDVAPTRKRRHRVQKNLGQEASCATQKTVVQQKQRSNPVPPEKAVKKPSSRKRSLEVMESTEDPDDLFNDM